jgi:hypothetical protein
MNPQQIAEQAVRQFLADDTVAQNLGITVSDIAPGDCDLPPHGPRARGLSDASTVPGDVWQRTRRA